MTDTDVSKAEEFQGREEVSGTVPKDFRQHFGQVRGPIEDEGAFVTPRRCLSGSRD